MLLVRFLAPPLAALALIAAPIAATAHEFWLDLERWTLEPGQEMIGHLRNGDHFVGDALAFLPQAVSRFELNWSDGAAAAPIDARMGDRPALRQRADGEGLAILVATTRFQLTSYDTLEDFARFTTKKGYPDAAAAHRARALPEIAIGERFRRFVKALARVGDQPGSDRLVGLQHEIVIDGDPYALAAGAATLGGALYFEGAPRANAQIELFTRKADGAVEERVLRTDDEGRFEIPVAPGAEYLVNAVALRGVLGDPSGALWETLWASNTFATPMGAGS